MSNIFDNNANIVDLTDEMTNIDGLGGVDTLVINGSSSDYVIERLNQTTYTLTALVTDGPVKKIHFTSIEKIQFNDGILAPADSLAISLNDSDGDYVIVATTVPDSAGKSFVITQGSGDDVITGGATNKDIVNYSGNASDYWISIVDGNFNVFDLRNGTPNGSDTLIDVEFIRFSDKLVSLANLAR